MIIKDKIKRIKERRSNLRLSSKKVQADTRAIKCNWTVEMADELSVFGGDDWLWEKLNEKEIVSHNLYINI